MTITQPSAAPIVPSISGSGIPTSFRPYTDITEFTYRTGMTHMALLENMRVWIQETLIPFLNDNFEDMEDAWETQVTGLIEAVTGALDTQRDNVNAALEEQTAAYQQAIADALNAIAEADIPISDPMILAVLNTTTSATRQWLDNHYGSKVVTPDAVKAAYTVADSVLKAALDAAYEVKGSAQKVRDDYARLFATQVQLAPAPKGSGQDDTTALRAVIDTAHATGATVYLQRGTYLCNLDLPAQFPQVKIIGQGMWGTILKAYTKTKPVVKFNGGSGAFGGGGLYEVGLTSADGANREGIALVFSGTTGCSARNVRINGSFSEGIRFWNERGSNGTGDFTEFNTFEGDISGCANPVRYQVDNGVESFHGSGLVGSTTINVFGDSDTDVVYIDKNAVPYNAPMSFTVWFQPNTNSRLFHVGAQGRAAGRGPSYYGTIRVENHPGGSDNPMGISDNNLCNILFAGQIMWLGSGSCKLGNILLCRKIAYEGGNVWGEWEPISSHATLKNSPTIIATAGEGGSLCLVALTVQAPNYEYHALYALQVSAFDGSKAFLTRISLTQALDSNNKGEPNISWNGALYASNPNFDSSFNAYVTVTNMGGSPAHMLLAQARYA